MTWLYATVTALALGQQTAPPASQPPSFGDYVFVPDTRRWVGIIRGRTILVGKLDADGKLHERDRVPAGSPDGLGKRRGHHIINKPDENGPYSAYEFRAG